MNALECILAILAVWRLTHLIAAENGPFKLIAWLRQKTGDGFWGSLLDCFYCLSLWIAIPFALAIGVSRWQKFLLWPSLSGAAILLNRLADRVAPDSVYSATPEYFEEPAPTIQPHPTTPDHILKEEI
jgi:hypothetical protein